MPIMTRIPLRRLSQTEFGDIAYAVMEHVFAIHNEIGRFFDERIFKLELAQRLPDVRLEEPVEVTFGSFRKTEIPLYEEAVVQHFGGPERVQVDVPVSIGGRQVGRQPMRLLAPGVALKITGFDRSMDEFETHARRLLAHVDIHAIAWVNINLKQVTFTTLTR